MNQGLKSAKLIGHASSTSKCQVFESDSITLLLLQQDESGFNLSTNIGTLFFDTFKNNYFSGESSSKLENLKEALREAKKEYKDQELAIAVSVVEGEFLYLALEGALEIYLLRQANLARILQSSKKLISASGELKENDTLILTTARFFQSQPAGVIKAALLKTNLDESIETLAPLMAEQEGEGAAILTNKKITPKTEIIQKKHFSKIKISLLSLIDYLLRFFPDRKVYVGGELEASFKVKRSAGKSALLGVMLMIILAISIVFGIRRSKSNALNQTTNKNIEQIMQVVDEAHSLQTLNPTRARVLILQAQSMAKELQEKSDDPKIDELEKKINEQIESIAGLYVVSPQLFSDLSLVSSGMKGDVAALSLGRMLVLDKSARKVVSINIENKKTQVIASPTDLDNASDIAIYVSRNFALTDNGVVELVSPTREVLKKDWDRAKILAYTGNMYVLDDGSRAIYRFSGAGNDFTNKTEWLSSDAFPEGEIKAWAIDGAIWVLAGNDVYRYLSGVEDSFFLQGTNVSNLDYLYTDEELEDLYLLDKQNSNILVFDKKGQFKVEYKSDLLKDTNSFIVSQKDKKIIFLVGSKLYSIDLKH